MTPKEPPASGPGPTVRELAAKGIVLSPTTIADWLWNYTTIGVVHGILEMKAPPGEQPNPGDITLAECLGYKREWVERDYDEVDPVLKEGL